MRLGHYDLESPIELSEDNVNVLIVENPKLLSKLVIELMTQRTGLEGGFTLWDRDSAVPFHKTADIIFDPFSADINRREILTQLYKRMERDALGEDLYMHTNELLSRIENGFRKIVDSQDLSVESDSPDILGLFKIMNLRFEVSDSLLERMCDYLDTCHEYLGFRVFVFINLKSFLSAQELSQFYEHSRYKKHILLLIENRQRETIEREILRVIDEDLCEIGFSEENYL